MEYSPDTEKHLRILATRDRKAVLNAVEQQLSHEPTAETRNRKPMRPNPIAPGELRIGNLRVYYDVGHPDRRVSIRAVGIKERNLVLIGNEMMSV